MGFLFARVERRPDAYPPELRPPPEPVGYRVRGTSFVIKLETMLALAVQWGGFALGLTGLVFLGWFIMEPVPRMDRAVTQAAWHVFGPYSPIDSLALRIGALFSVVYVLANAVVGCLKIWARLQAENANERYELRQIRLEKEHSSWQDHP